MAIIESNLKQVQNRERSVTPIHSSPAPSAIVEEQINLPKLIITPFDGNILNWVSFWDQFESSIHLKNNISDIDKFSYLRSFLSPRAEETVSGLTLTAENYAEAVDLLKKRYGNPQILINSYMEQFVSLESVAKSNDVFRLRKLFN